MANSFDGLNMTPSDTLEEALVRYKIDFPVEKRPLRFPDSEGDYKFTSPWHVQTVNVDTDQALGVVGHRYQLVPNRDAFAIADPMLSAGAALVGGGAPNFGERAYLVLETQQRLTISPGDDIVNRYMLLNSYDGSCKIELRFTPYRELTGIAYTPSGRAAIRFKHTMNVQARVNAVRKAFRRINEDWDQFTAGAKRMMGYHLTPLKAREFVEAVLPSSGEEDSTKLKNNRDEVINLFHTGTYTQMPQCKGTLFGAVQAFGEWADGREAKKSKIKDEASANISARLIADGAKKKARAWGVAMALVKVGERTKGVFSNV